MSLTYSLNQPGQGLSRTTAVALIVFIHVGGFIALNNGIGKYLKISLPPTTTFINLKPDPKPVESPPPPELPKALLDQSFKPQISDPSKIVINIAPDAIGDTPPIGPIDVETPKIGDQVIPPTTRVAVLNRVDPTYPAGAEAAGQQGTVLLDVQIDAHGNVVAVNIVQSSGFGALDAAAAKAVRRWHFSSTMTGAHVRLPIKFQLNS